LNWYKNSLEQTFSQIKGILLTLHYSDPDLDISKLSFDQILDLVKSHNLVPENMTPERLTTMIKFYLDKEEGEIYELV
jgi:hypothetical protein